MELSTIPAFMHREEQLDQPRQRAQPKRRVGVFGCALAGVVPSATGSGERGQSCLRRMELARRCFLVSSSESIEKGSTPMGIEQRRRSLRRPWSPRRRQSPARKQHLVRAKLMQDKDEQLASEKAMHSNIFADKFLKRKAKNASNETSAFSKQVIQIEQTTNILLTNSVIKILDAFYRDRCYARFYVLETIARVPYFAFMSILHMYESFGWWRKADYLKVHFAESWNELHHLLIMEELGGNAMWYDRFLAQHIAILYYFLTVLMYAISPRMAYHFSECVERHAFETYDKFIKLHEEDLKKMPAPDIAIKYYTEGDLYLFDEFQTSRPPCTRRPKIDNLYDVFVNIRDDEAEHCKTMKTCQTHGALKSPHSSMNDFDDNSECSLSQQADCEGFVDCVRKSLAPQKK